MLRLSVIVGMVVVGEGWSFSRSSPSISTRRRVGSITSLTPPPTSSFPTAHHGIYGRPLDFHKLFRLTPRSMSQSSELVASLSAEELFALVDLDGSGKISESGRYPDMNTCCVP